MTRLMFAIKTTAVLTIWAGGAAAHTGEAAQTTASLQPAAVLIAQPIQSPMPQPVIGDICEVPAVLLSIVPTGGQSRVPLALACLAE
ncbi:hypothetical protein [Yoonia sp. 208BN28-4]|uniref:hypothetical protein n=1 Tax=Yoonia sp. 208BN28-4 TaxID=3126505 RepID=UPI0030A0A790